MRNKALPLSALRKLPEFGALVGFLTFFVIFSAFGKSFFTLSNLSAILTLSAELGILSVAVTLLMVSGEFDLSVSSVYAICALLFIDLGSAGIPSLFVFVLVLAVAAFIGLANGVLTTVVGVPSFIATLGMMMAVRGIIYIFTGGAAFAYKGDLVIPALLSLRFGETLRLSETDPLAYLRPSHVWFLLFIIVFTVLLFRTRYGNHVIATGGHPETARAMGVKTGRVKTINFMICGVMAGMSGIIIAGRFLMVSPTMGQGLELEAIAAVVIGGTSLRGGHGTIAGTLFGVLLVSMVRGGLLMIGAPPYWYSGIVGLILLFATVINLKMR